MSSVRNSTSVSKFSTKQLVEESVCISSINPIVEYAQQSVFSTRDFRENAPKIFNQFFC